MSQWLTRAQQAGVCALYSRKAAGSTTHLTVEEWARLPALLSRYRELRLCGDLWTREQGTTVVQRKFGVTYSLQQIGRLLRTCGWTVQRPVKRFTQRNEAAIQRWLGS
jgi:transposase